MGRLGHRPVMTRLTFPNTSNILAILCSQHKSDAFGDGKNAEKCNFTRGLLRKYFQTMYGFKWGELRILLPSVCVFLYWRTRRQNNRCSTEGAR